MSLHKHRQANLCQAAKEGLTSLLSQTVYVFVGFAVMLLLTRGNPSALVLSITFVVGVGFVAWCEKKRLTGR